MIGSGANKGTKKEDVSSDNDHTVITVSSMTSTATSNESAILFSLFRTGAVIVWKLTSSYKTK